MLSGWYAKYCFGLVVILSCFKLGKSFPETESRIFYGNTLSNITHIFHTKTSLAMWARAMWLTVPLNNLLWQFCLSLRLYRGTERCPQVCAAEDHSPKEIGFPARVFEMLTPSWCLLKLKIIHDPRHHFLYGKVKKEIATFLGSILNFFLPTAICLFLWVLLLLCDVK